MKTDIKQLTEKELILFVESLTQKAYRARQIINWLYKKHASSFDEMTDLSKGFREELKKRAFISNLKLLKMFASRDGTQKFLFRLSDGETVESVLIPDRERNTLCISSQVGCKRACRFCMTGRLGLKRNLKAFEIVDQVIAVKRVVKDAKITNIVLMGMGEPIDNLDEVMGALQRIREYMGFSKRKITLSTAGVIPGIRRLAEDGTDINLAISLNATTDEVRNKIMPINKEYPLRELIRVCKDFPLPARRRITFEYVMLDGINDSTEDALRLLRLLRGIRSKVNLIPYNPINKGLPQKEFAKKFKRPSEKNVVNFQKILLGAGIAAIVRKSKGQDIEAACGQLKGAYLSKEVS